MKNIFKKKETDEEVVELTPEEKKEKRKATGLMIVRTVVTALIGAGLTVIALVGIGAVTSKDSEETENDPEVVPAEENSEGIPEE